MRQSITRMCRTVPISLSVIIPIYRVEQWLNRCIESVLKQNYNDMEVILVDDGSPDNCPTLCDIWAKRDKRIRVIHKTNGGLSDARNAGLDTARGEYITFIDPDDFLAPNTLNTVMGEMHSNCDIIEYSAIKFYGSKRQEAIALEQKTYTNMKEYWVIGKAYTHAYAWNKIYRRQLFHRGIRFPKGRLFEDVYILPLLLKVATCVITTNKGLYYYCANPNGITMTANGEALSQLLDSHLEHCDVTANDEYFMHVLNIQMDVYEQTGATPRLPNFKIRHFSQLKGKLLLKAIVLNLLGVKRICQLNKLIHQVTRFYS